MELFKNNFVVGITAAVAATVLAPVLVPILAVAGRPIAKSLVKGGVILYEKGREKVAGAGEVMEDLIAEVRSELEQQPRTAAATGEAAVDSAAQRSGTGQRPSTGSTEEAISPHEPGAPLRPTGNGARM